MLRVEPSFATAHTFCAPRDGRLEYFLRTVPTITITLTIRKARFSKGYWNTNIKLGVTTHFKEIIKLQFGKSYHTLLHILKLLGITVA